MKHTKRGTYKNKYKLKLKLSRLRPIYLPRPYLETDRQNESNTHLLLKRNIKEANHTPTPVDYSDLLRDRRTQRIIQTATPKNVI